ncbi:hypothetical protein [Dolichospermum circinale]|uniref:hypothetical protein n=1 Tax=Dolichospermum circinale TaxID=109265 RepID=UPI00232D5E4D|nr:hypothetical protein [Dolichospermum circinale]MDB9448664.1 hypothetical protein [Dolichospermum circinale CS-547]
MSKIAGKFEINQCKSHDELDFLFPELTRIHNHDLVIIESWQNHVDWVKSLPPAELKLLNSADFNNSETTQTITNPEIPPEQISYENIAEKSHFYSLRDQLLFMFAPELRREYENYVSQQAANSGYRTLVTSNLQQASDLTVANLFHYFNIRDESQEDESKVS